MLRTVAGLYHDALNPINNPLMRPFHHTPLTRSRGVLSIQNKGYCWFHAAVFNQSINVTSVAMKWWWCQNGQIHGGCTDWGVVGQTRWHFMQAVKSPR
jgi:hypothetical protein